VLLSLQGISAPTLQSTLSYALLAAAYGGWLLLRNRRALSKPWWCYALLGLLDVEANFCLVSRGAAGPL
jgi:solute carrier family 35 protein F1/2